MAETIFTAVDHRDYKINKDESSKVQRIVVLQDADENIAVYVEYRSTGKGYLYLNVTSEDADTLDKVVKGELDTSIGKWLRAEIETNYDFERDVELAWDSHDQPIIKKP